MKYNTNYLRTHDIDWFCIIGDVFCHVASAGGMIPDVINDREKLRGLQKRVFDSDFIFDEDDIVVNESFLNQHFGNDEEARTAYLHCFMSMARKGFVSFDRTNVIDLNDQTYHIVCYPKNPIKLPEFHDLCKVEGNVLRKELSNIQLLEYFA